MNQALVAICNICTHKFNTRKHLPIIICPQAHCLCLQCLQSLAIPFACPFCKVSINKGSVKLDQACFTCLGGSPNTNVSFRYRYFREQLRITPVNSDLILEKIQNEQQLLLQQQFNIAKNILKVLTLLFLVFTIINIIMQLFLVWTQEEQCIDWDQKPNSYTIRHYLKFSILFNVACFSVAGLLVISENESLKGFMRQNGQKIGVFYIACRLFSEIWMWSYFMFEMQPQCSSFIFLYLHILTFGYYFFGFLFTPALAYFYVKKQNLNEPEQ